MSGRRLMQWWQGPAEDDVPHPCTRSYTAWLQSQYTDSMLVQLRGHEPFTMQKNVLRQSEGSPVPIAQGKMAQCAAEVVDRWLEEVSYNISLGYRSY